MVAITTHHTMNEDQRLHIETFKNISMCQKTLNMLLGYH